MKLVNIFQNKVPRTFYRIGLLVITSILVLVALVFPIALRPSSLPIKLGEVSPQNFIAPRSMSFESAVLTRITQEAASNSISNQYLPQDTTISRSQIKKLQAVINYISTVRSDFFSNTNQKTTEILQINNLNLSLKVIGSILNLPDLEWEIVSQEAVTTLEKTMQRSIRDYQVQETQSNVSSFISYSIPEMQASIISELVKPYIVANSLFSNEATLLAKQLSIEAVKPVLKTYVQNQTIVLRGQVVSEEQLEVLQLFGLATPENKLRDLLASLSIVITLVGFIALYFSRRNVKTMRDLKSLTVIAVGFLIFLFGARFLIPNRTVIPYFFPISAYALILVTLFDLEIGIIFSLALSILAAFGLSNSSDLSIFYMITSLIGALTLGRGRSVANFFGAAIAIALSGTAVLLAYKSIDPTSDLIGIVTLIAATFLNSLASASLALLIQYLLSQLFGFLTPLYLLEISRPDHPLLKYLLQFAPGTYQHSLLVSNLAEQAAEAIGADSLLTRVGTLYHDVGKANNALFFIENQTAGKIESHDNIDPMDAAQTIIRHVSDGLVLADKYRLPPRLKDFICEHHGTHLTRYQYNRAIEVYKNDLTKISPALFRYPGPKPRSKETALLMLADGCEARVRAEIPNSIDEISTIVMKVFDYCLVEGQFENTNLTINDLFIARLSFIKTLTNSFHPRIQYPESVSDVNSSSTTE